jgi:anthranilate synthase component 1
MIVPTLSEFRTLARGGKLVLVYREVTLTTTRRVGVPQDRRGHSFLLESVEGGEKWGRFSLLGSRPSLVFIARGDRCEIHRGGVVTQCVRHPIDELAELLREHQAIALPGLPRFCGGAVGYFGYDAVRWFERLPSRAKDDLGLPDAVFLFGDVVSVFDNLTHTLKVVTHARGGDDPEAAYHAAVGRIEAEVARLSRALPGARPTAVRCRSGTTRRSRANSTSPPWRRRRSTSRPATSSRSYSAIA